MKRVEWIDIAKGIGIVLVTMGHTNARHLLGDYVGWWINAFHMPLFFVMAGLCFDVNRYPNFIQYLLRKLRALGWPFFALSVFMAVISIVLYWGTDPQWSCWGQMRLILRCDSPVNTFWFIETLFEVEIVFWLLARLLRKPALVLGAVTVLGGIGAFVVPEGGQVLKYNTLLVSLFYYGLGFVGRELEKGVGERGWTAELCTGFGAMAVYSILIATSFHYAVGYWGCLLGNKFWFFPLSVLAIFGVSATSMVLARIPYVRGTFVWLGVNSIVLMAIHGHCGIFRKSWVERGFGGLPSVVVEYALFAVLAWALAGPLNFLVRFPWGTKKR